MNPLDRLQDYLARLESRMRLGLACRGAAFLALAALAVTVALVAITNRVAFSAASMTGARLALYLCLGVAIVFALAVPLLRLNRKWAARRAELASPGFQQRLLTVAERASAGVDDPFLHLLAADTLEHAAEAHPARIVQGGRIAAFASLAAVAAGVLLWLGLAGPGYLGYGTALLWAGTTRGDRGPLYDLRVTPGNQTVRRKADLLVTAVPVGFQTDKAQLYARYQGASRWEKVEMRPQQGAAGFEFLFASLPETVDYYVAAGAVRSPQFQLRVVDLPSVKRIRVTYRYPGWTGLPEAVVERGGDLRAVQGTEAALQIETDRPVSGGLLVVNDDEPLPLQEAAGNLYTARIRIEKDGAYHVASRDGDRRVRLTEDYFIEAQREEAPKVRIGRPGNDYRASPIEEVTVQVEAEDDFGLQELSLRYSVNGGPEQVASLLARKGDQQVSGTHVLSLEDFKLVPGDLVSFYGVARDARLSARTDMFFVEAQPFEREYSQSQQAGGAGGGAGEDDNQISARQKEIIAATWNELRASGPNPAEAAEIARFLADVEGKLRDQARSLARRMQSRELSQANQEFSSFTKDMNAAADEMNAAVDKLKAMRWKEALAPEQKALQHLLRAEATRRRIQVAFGNRGGGRGGRGMGRDLENLFDLELDTEKNQYETGRQAASADQRAREIDEALQRLEQLARRQQELARQRQNQQSFQQRWQQEMLRREAEQLQRRMEQLARGEPSPGSQASQQEQGGERSQGGQESSGGRPMRAGRATDRVDPRVDRALERLRQATEDMRRASRTPQSGQGISEAEARRAAERLQEAGEMLSGLRRDQAAGQMDQIVGGAERLAERQKALTDELRKLYGSQQAPGTPQQQQQSPQQPAVSREQLERMAAERREMAADLERLERQMQQAARDMASGQRAASSKLREALGQVQQEELGLRLKYSAEWIRRGLGASVWVKEAPVSRGLNDLRDRVREAQQAMAQAPQGQQAMERALEQVERMRAQMESSARGAQGRRDSPGQAQGREGASPGREGAAQGRQGGQSPQGAAGERGSDPAGSQVGEYRGGGGWRDYRDNYSAMNRGDYMPSGPAGLPRGADPAAVERAWRETLRDLGQLRSALRETPELARDIQELIAEMQRLDPSRFPGNPAMVERLRAQVLAGLEQLELRLRRDLQDQRGDQVRSGDSRPVPPGYQEAVAEYFRQLGKSR